ncbi:MAG: HIT family protein [Candidatus Dojkabacteria bacterium]|nr:HIT family protein [Candidatus Dojkabacteria bacterium]
MQYKSPTQYPDQVIIKETEHWYITLWKNQYYLGRASIEYKDLSKKHLSELSNEEVLELFSLIKSYETALKKAFDTTNFNWTCLMNNQYKEKNKDNPERLHLHVWPRYKERVEFNEKTFEDEVFAHHYDKHKEKYVSRDFLIVLADEILGNWNN